MQASEEEDDIIETDLFYDIKNRLRKRVTTNSLDLKEAKFSYILNQSQNTLSAALATASVIKRKYEKDYHNINKSIELCNKSKEMRIFFDNGGIDAHPLNLSDSEEESSDGETPPEFSIFSLAHFCTIFNCKETNLSQQRPKIEKLFSRDLFSENSSVIALLESGTILHLIREQEDLACDFWQWLLSWACWHCTPETFILFESTLKNLSKKAKPNSSVALSTEKLKDLLFKLGLDWDGNAPSLADTKVSPKPIYTEHNPFVRSLKYFLKLHSLVPGDWLCTEYVAAALPRLLWASLDYRLPCLKVEFQDCVMALVSHIESATWVQICSVLKKKIAYVGNWLYLTDFLSPVSRLARSNRAVMSLYYFTASKALEVSNNYKNLTGMDVEKLLQSLNAETTTSYTELYCKIFLVTRVILPENFCPRELTAISGQLQRVHGQIKDKRACPERYMTKDLILRYVQYLTHSISSIRAGESHLERVLNEWAS